MAEMLLDLENVGKKYARTLRSSLSYGMKDVVSEVFGNREQGKLREEEFWAVRDVTFQLHRGECIAVLGANGAGKSTLLKVISGVLGPDTGKITRHGRMEKMIELSAGLAPSLTGRQNVALRTRMLGLSKIESLQRLDEVVAFAELDDFIDSPVMYYSSGMKARLGFATTVVMKPDILIIDEILAVGDLSFRMKCYERVDQMRRTAAVVLVTHGMNHVSRLATTALVLHKGNAVMLGTPQAGIAMYQELAGGQGPSKTISFHPELIDVSMRINGEPWDGIESIPYGCRLSVEAVHSHDEKIEISVLLHEGNGPTIADWHSRRMGFQAKPGEPFLLEIGPVELCPGFYQWVVVGFAPDGTQLFLSAPIRFKVLGTHLGSTRMQPRGKWSTLAAPAQVVASKAGGA